MIYFTIGKKHNQFLFRPWHFQEVEAARFPDMKMVRLSVLRTKPPLPPREIYLVEICWYVMVHGDAREEKWGGNKRMEWVTSKCHMTAEHRLARAVQNLQTDVHNSAASSRLNWGPRRFKRIVRFAERRNLVYARVTSHLKRSILVSVRGWVEPRVRYSAAERITSLENSTDTIGNRTAIFRLVL